MLADGTLNSAGHILGVQFFHDMHVVTVHATRRGAQTSHPCIPAKVFWAHPGQRVWLASLHPGIRIPTHYSILASFLCNNSASLHPLLRGIPASWHPDCQASSHPRISSQFFFAATIHLRTAVDTLMRLLLPKVSTVRQALRPYLYCCQSAASSCPKHAGLLQACSSNVWTVKP
jgi:hypothetical protein